MKKVTWEATTERMYVQLVQEVPEEKDLTMSNGMMAMTDSFPTSYLMIGKPGSKERTRVEGPDAELLLLALGKVMSMRPGAGMHTMGRIPMPPGTSPFGSVG